LSKDVEKRVIKITGSMGNPKLKDLVEKLEDEGLNFRDVAKTVYALWKQDELDLLEPSFPSTLLRYALSLQSLWFWALTALVALMIPIVFYVVDAPFLYIRYVLGSLFVLYLPGSMLIEALYSKSQDLERLERLALSIGLSVAVIPLIGLVLNYTPWGIRLTPITLSLATFTEAMAITALIRKYRYYTLTRSRP
jgi:uncharacterized membrane protein